jgi:hypothetical protein
MRPTPELAALLRRTADRLQAQHWGFWDREYCWRDSTRCNCGLLVREALGWDQQQLSLHIHRGTWRTIAQTAYRTAAFVAEGSLASHGARPRACGWGMCLRRWQSWGLTGQKTLLLSKSSAIRLSWPASPKRGWSQLRRDYALHVALYMRELADWIEEQLQAQAQLSHLTQPLPKAKATEVAVRQPLRLR